MILLYGLATFITGGLLRFKPLIYGAIAAWIIGVVAFQVRFEITVLLIGLSMITSYLLPGYLLKRKEG